MRAFLFSAALLASAPCARADDPTGPPPATPQPPSSPTRPDPAALAKQVRPALVAIQPAGRDGETAGIGSGFAISADGLIATNFHVIGEGRALKVETSDGRELEVTGVHAWDRHADLAVLRVAAKDLPFLNLADSTAVQQGDYAAAMGNPLGLRFSMVEGIVSALQEVEGRRMLQLSLPIERGNSGGPVIDRNGKVTGIVALKSTLTENLGFAVPSAQLQSLLDRPTPVAMSAWLRIGALNSNLWQPDGGRWSQRAGVIRARGRRADAFGGRTLCIHQPEPPALPFELSVRVRLDSESGAAGLIFCSDGKDTHYGFYPSGGGLRLTRFEGPDVNSWTILAQLSSDAYEQGSWNQLRVRVEAERIVCWVNGREVIVCDDRTLRTGRVGLCKFRDTEADFKDFRTGSDLSGSTGPADAVSAMMARLAAGEAPADADRSLMQQDPALARDLAARAASDLEKRAAALRRLADNAHAARTAADLASLLAKPDESPGDLPRAAILIARLDNPEVDPDAVMAEIDRLTAELQASLTDEHRASPEAKLAALNDWMFRTSGFHGSRDEMESRSNSYLNEVIDDREGLPITLSILHREFGRRIGLDLVGAPFPGRFMTRLRLTPDDSPSGPVIDVFDDGRVLTPDKADALIMDLTGELPDRDAWAPATPRATVLRMLNNLCASAAAQRDDDRLLRYLDAALAVDPDAASQRLQRLLVHAKNGRRPEALADAAWIMEHQPPGIDLDRLRDLTNTLEQRP